MNAVDDEKSEIYQTPDGAIALRIDSQKETLWATQAEVAELFGVTTQNITIHLKKIFSDGELDEEATCKKSLQVRTEGDRTVTRTVKEYNLDVILSVGYRVNSTKATRFRQWATRTLRAYITEGYAINPTTIERNYQKFLSAVDDFKRLIPTDTPVINTDEVLELVKAFSSTWLTLESYDTGFSSPLGWTNESIRVTVENLTDAVGRFRLDMLRRGQASSLFAQEASPGTFSGIVGNVFQSFGGIDLYPTIEEKAAHLLYFIIKNHPFADGNKRSGAFAFAWFLSRANFLHTSHITAEVLSTLAILIAESNPKEKDRVVWLVVFLLKNH